jgi:chromosome segregation ATPase
MIEPIMFFGIGFLVASLFGLVFIPLVHNRAVRLTMKRLEAATPLSMAEIQADKDQLRAEFAMSTRRLELSVEQMKAKTTSQLAELGKKTDAINRLKSELGEKTAAMFSLEAREKSLKDQLRATESEHSAKLGALRDAERMLAEKQSELAKLSTLVDERSTAANTQRTEAATLHTQVTALKERVAGYERDTRELSERLSRERKGAAAATAELQEERGKAEKLSDRVTQLERALVVQTTEAEIRGRRVREMEARLSDQMKMLSERDTEISQLRDTISAGRKLEAELRADLASAAGRNRSTAENLTKEKALMEDQLAQAKAERAKLHQEIADLKREADQSWGAERIENALLRDRLNDIAAEIARLTVALEGIDSPIEAMLSGTPPGTKNPRAAKTKAGGTTTESKNKGSLADRIRALQLKAASRAPVPN